MTEQNSGGDRFGFTNTQWSLLGAALESSQARSRLIERYYRPARAYLLILTRNSDQADEVLQSFLATELERLTQKGAGGVVRGADRARGRFRDYLKASLRNHWLAMMRREQRGLPPVRPDDDHAWDKIDIPTHKSAERSFDKVWVEQLIAEALSKVEAICRERGQRGHLEIFLAHFLPAPGTDESWEAIARRFKLPDGKTARNRAQTPAGHFRTVLRELLAEEDAGTDLSEEVRGLLYILGDDHDRWD